MGGYRILCLFIVILPGWISCRKEAPIGSDSESTDRPVTLSITGYDRIDSAQVFFFRRFSDRDSLMLRQTIYDLTTSVRRFEFDLPLGIYDIVVIGNVTPEHVFMKPPYSQDSLWVYYSGRQPIPAIYLAHNRMNVGVDTLGFTGMRLMTAAVKLTVEQIPRDVARMEVVLLNTDSGFNFNSGGLNIPVQPDLQTTLDDLRTDSSYTVEISSFPTVTQKGNSSLKISCYDINDQLVFTGQSVSFPAQWGRRRVVTCRFQPKSQPETKGRSRIVRAEECNLIWRFYE